MARLRPEEFSKQLKAALDGYDHAEVLRLCDTLLEHLATTSDLYKENAAKDILSALRNKRYFVEMARVADAFVRTGLQTPQIRRQYAQSLTHAAARAAPGEPSARAPSTEHATAEIFPTSSTPRAPSVMPPPRQTKIV